MVDPTPSTGATQIFNVLQNLVQALNNAATTFLNVNGSANLANISVPTVVSPNAGRICEVSILTAGTTQGIAYDGASLADVSRPLFDIPNVVGVYKANWPVGVGIMIVPGSGQVISVSYS